MDESHEAPPYATLSIHCRDRRMIDTLRALARARNESISATAERGLLFYLAALAADEESTGGHER